VHGESDGRLQSVAVGSDVRVYDYYGAAEASPGELEALTGVLLGATTHTYETRTRVSTMSTR
jgi:hypothetical protein